MSDYVVNTGADMARILKDVSPGDGIVLDSEVSVKDEKRLPKGVEVIRETDHESIREDAHAMMLAAQAEQEAKIRAAMGKPE